MPRVTSIARFTVVGLLAAALLVPAGVAGGQAAGQECPAIGSSTVSGEVTSQLVTETSGVAASRSQPGVLWIHNDSGNSSDLYAVTPGGALLMRVILQDVPNWDYEDIAIGPGPDGDTDYLYIADVGANQLGRDTVRIFRLAEPKVTSGTVTISESQVERFTFAYENPTTGGTWNRNAESMAVDPVSGDVVIIEKHQTTVGGVPNSSWVYRIRQHELIEGETIRAKPMVAARVRYNGGTIASTAADFSPDGKVLFVKNNNEIVAWTRKANQTIYQAIATHPDSDCVWAGPGGEAITVAADGSSLYSIPEGNTPNITKVTATLPDPGLTCDGVMVTIKGTGADDVLIGTARRDIMHGRGGGDDIEGRGGDDVICGGDGGDVILGNGGGDRIHAGLGADEVRGGPGSDAIRGNAGPDALYGQAHADTLRGGAGSDTLRGGPGYDTLNGGPGDDACGLGDGGGTKQRC